jgi:hypothetical protein
VDNIRESILTIPINEVLEPHTGCPVCLMRDMLESRTVAYIMGDAMMEPDIRTLTNKTGFCERHFAQMKNQKNRLSLALMLQTHLQKLEQDYFSGKPYAKKDPRTDKIKQTLDDCFVCGAVQRGMLRFTQTLCEMSADADGAKLISEQEMLCLPHFQYLIETAPRFLSKKNLDNFTAIITELTKKQIALLYNDVSHFCSMYDYRNSGKDADWGNSRDSIERAIKFLCSS